MRIINDRFLKAIAREPVDKTPIWLMRQAGRYLPEYRELRNEAGSFMNLCKTPSLAAAVTLQPLRRFDLDAAIIFSDILTIPDALGLDLTFIEGRGPIFSRPIESASAIKKFSLEALSTLSYTYEAISLVQKELKGQVPLIGFSGSPFTLAAYMIQGESKPSFPRTFLFLKEEERAMHSLLSFLSEAVSLHLIAQIKAGAQAIMIFDTWGGLLKESYPQFSLHYLQQIVATVKAHDRAPIILFTKGGGNYLRQLAETGCDVISLDADIDIQDARARIGHLVALQGNLDPKTLLKTEACIEQEVSRILTSYGKGSGHIFNLGHGVTPDVPPEHVKHLVDTVHHLSQAFH